MQFPAAGYSQLFTRDLGYGEFSTSVQPSFSPSIFPMAAQVSLSRASSKERLSSILLYLWEKAHVNRVSKSLLSKQAQVWHQLPLDLHAPAKLKHCFFPPKPIHSHLQDCSCHYFPEMPSPHFPHSCANSVHP